MKIGRPLSFSLDPRLFKLDKICSNLTVRLFFKCIFSAADIAFRSRRQSVSFSGYRVTQFSVKLTSWSVDVNSITLLHKTIRIVVGKNTFFPFHDLHSRPLTRSLTTRRNHRSLNGQREIPRRATVLGQIPASGMQCLVHSIKAEIIGERSLQ